MEKGREEAKKEEEKKIIFITVNFKITVSNTADFFSLLVPRCEFLSFSVILPIHGQRLFPGYIIIHILPMSEIPAQAVPDCAPALYSWKQPPTSVPGKGEETGSLHLLGRHEETLSFTD